MNEARTIARFRHHNVTQVRRYFELNGTGYIVLNLESGQPLDKLLKDGALSAGQLQQIFSRILDGLETVHQAGVLHRDIKPNNIIIRPDGSPVLIDFGAARAFEQRQHSMTTIMSPGYAPPEQYGEGGLQGFWTDFYALGATMYQCVTGQKPSDSLYRLQLSRANKDPLMPAEKLGAGRYDGAFLRLIDWMMRLNESERPQTVAEIKKYLSAPADRRSKPSRGKRRVSPALLITLPGLALAVLGIAYLANSFYEQRNQMRNAKEQRLAASLGTAGFDRAKLGTVENECGSDCPRSLEDELNKRMAVLDSESEIFRAAEGNIETLSGYLKSCRACEFETEAQADIGDLASTALEQAGTDAAKLQQFIFKCQNTCPEQPLQEARKRLDGINSELTQYRKAEGNRDLLNRYLRTCTICASREEAEKQLQNLDTNGLRDASKTASSKHEETPQPDSSPREPLIEDPITLNEIRDRLFEQNFDPGRPGSAEMAEAIRAYNEKLGRSNSDQPAEGLLESLRRAPSLNPWGAITFSKAARKWGMSWNLARGATQFRKRRSAVRLTIVPPLSPFSATAAAPSLFLRKAGA